MSKEIDRFIKNFSSVYDTKTPSIKIKVLSTYDESMQISVSVLQNPFTLFVQRKGESQHRIDLVFFRFLAVRLRRF